MSPRAGAELALVAVTLLWGATFVLVKTAIDQIPTAVFLAGRFGIAAAAVALFFARRLKARPELRRISLRGGLWAGLCLTLGYFFQTVGLRYTTPSKSAFITGLTSALVPFLVAIVYKEAPHVSEVIGVAVAAVGLALLTVPSGALAIGYGDAISLCCTFAFACHILVLGRYAGVTAFELFSFTQIAVTAILAAGAAFAGPLPALTAAWRVVPAMLFTGVLATAVPFTVQAWAQRHTTPTRAALIFAFEPVSAMIVSFLVAGEVLSLRGIVGAALILAGVLAVALKPAAGSKHPSQ